MRCRRLTQTWSLFLSTIVLILSLAKVSAAQGDSERAAARAAAEAGDKAFKEGNYEEAADYFTRAENIMHAPTLLLFVARSHAKLGRLVLAREAYIKIQREQLAADAPAAFRAAQDSANQELAEIEKRIAQLTIRVDGPPREAVRVAMDGQTIPSDMIGLPYPSDPGAHTLQVSAEGYQPKEVEVRLEEGASREVSVSLAANAGSAAQETEPPSEDQESSGTKGSAFAADAAPAQSDPGNGLRLGAYIGFGVGIVGAGLGTLFIVQRGGAQDDADGLFEACAAAGNGRSCNDPDAISEIQDLDDEVASKGTLAAVSYVVGGVGLAAGVVLYLLSDPGDSTEAQLTPYFTGTSAGVVGRF
jgi:tetratricopeptide (TPR) repeat protein